MTKKTNREENLVCVAKFNVFVDFIYPILTNMDNINKDFKSIVLQNILDMPRHIYEAAHTDQISKVRILDARLANIKNYVRMMPLIRVQKYDKRKGKTYYRRALTVKQASHAGALLAVVGGMISKWLDRLDPKRVERRERREREKLKNTVNDAPLEFKG